MLPSVMAKQLKKGLSDYIETTFPVTNKFFKTAIKNLVDNSEEFSHEPFVSVKMPFRKTDKNYEFESLHSDFKYHLHQQKAFERLSKEPKSTLIATGTGSGKTECFLYPILEYCYKHRGESGIKALIIYPMNALATDQSSRIAKLIHNSPELRNNVSVGIYVGGQEEHPSRMMDEEHIITDKETLLNSPPDILMTNYKMLDLLLVRPKDSVIWNENKSETLKFIAVDEFHTFDGAQGTDLACLIRRLKARLDTPKDYLCCIGTSATMGSKDSSDSITNYASEVFDEEFDKDSIITEDRLTAEEFLQDIEEEYFDFLTNDDVDKMQKYIDKEDINGYLTFVIKSWFNIDYNKEEIFNPEIRQNLSKLLMKHQFFKIFLKITDKKYFQTKYLVDELQDKYPDILKIQKPDILLDSILSLISHARNEQNRPFLFVQTQIWFKELRRLLAKVDKNIDLKIWADLNSEQSSHYLPIINCRDCGATGWTSRYNEKESFEIKDFEKFYNLFFKQDKKITMMFPCEEDIDENNIPKDLKKIHICPECMKVGSLEEQTCDCGTEYITVLAPPPNGKPLETSGGRSSQYVCPFCGSNRGLAIVGLRNTTEISTTLSQLFSSNFNDDRKLLTFSDNVQDAAHRAGFFNSRTWRFGLRGAIQKFALKKGNGLDLETFSDEFVKYWREQLSNEEFVSKFIPPNLVWMSGYKKMLADGKLTLDDMGKKLLSFISNRLKYEIMLEIGLNRQIGRTLEKSACLTIDFDEDTIDAIAKEVQEKIVNEIGIFRNQSFDLFKLLVRNYLEVIRSKGGFNDFVFNEFILYKGHSYYLSNDRNKYLPALQTGRNTPVFLYEIIGQARPIDKFDDYCTKGYINIVKSTLGKYTETLIWNQQYDDISKIVYESLKSNNLLVKMDSPNGYQIYALDKKQIYITTAVKTLECDMCGLKKNVSGNYAELLINNSCLQNNCNGKYELLNNGDDYYNKLYSNGDLTRVFAREHTGLLERDNREKLEQSFKHNGDDKKAWDTNVLSCTPTLEMGIDIGNLSSVVLCSMPPTQAQFLQRVGRAGRKDGNSLNIVVATTQPHDLYFYNDPLEMIDGVVEPPKIFLQASAVLERQLIAYCLDTWIKSNNVNEETIPKKILICLSNLEKKDISIFPFNFLNYIKNNLTNLLDGFLQMFPGMDEQTKNELINFAKGISNNINEENKTLSAIIYDAFLNVQQQIESFKLSIKRLNKLIKELNDKPKDSSFEEDIKELEAEQRALRHIIFNIKKKETFNFMSDEGLLPNYAFPESGIVLKAILYRKKDNDENQVSKHKYVKNIYEYNRAAASAISEFAPNNVFYAEGQKFEINQIDLTTSQIEKWRLCPNCAHAQLEEKNKDVTSCPNCGSTLWADAGQLRSMLKVQMVYSNMNELKSYIDDSSDDRQNKFYCKQTLVDVDEDNDIIKAYQMNNDDFPFGYEFIKKATIREINFGGKDDIGENLVVAGNEDKRTGFKICKSCGKIQKNNSSTNPNTKSEHAFSCKNKNKALNDKEAYEDCLFLYREFETEALRLLIPATTLSSNREKQESFVAAFMLGMKQYFGNVEHLRACITEVPDSVESTGRKQFLVIYDSIPGGTGYLKQLLQKENSLIEIFEKALNIMKQCNCENGCYHCLYAYKQSRNNGDIKKNVAIELLTKIISGKSNIEEIQKINNISVNSLFESDLEEKFIEVLKRLNTKEVPIEIAKILVHNKPGYSLKVGDLNWEIEPQVTLDNYYGVEVKTRADFVIWPSKNNKQKPIAIYTDGYTWHKDSVDDDTLKRLAIIKSERFIVWSLSYKDVQCKMEEIEHSPTNLFDEHNSPISNNSKNFNNFFNFLSKSELPNQTKQVCAEKNMDLLIKYLKGENFHSFAKAYAFCLLNLQASEQEKQEWILKNEYIIENDLINITRNYDHSSIICGSYQQNGYSLIQIHAITTPEKAKTADISVIAVFDDLIETSVKQHINDLNGFWNFVNIMQFASEFICISTKGVQSEVYNEVHSYNNNAMNNEKQIKDLSDSWLELLEIVDDSEKDFIYKLAENNIEMPTLDYELDNGELAQYAWEHQKIAILYDDEFKDAFIKQSWTIQEKNSILDLDILKKGHN